MVARDKQTGEVVGEVTLPGRPLGTPMTYEIGERQFIALTIATDTLPELIALALPGTEPPPRRRRREERGRDGRWRILGREASRTSRNTGIGVSSTRLADSQN